jgi:hypothetical protein
LSILDLTNGNSFFVPGSFRICWEFISDLEIRSLIRQYKMYDENRWSTPLYIPSRPLRRPDRFSPFSNISLLWKRLKFEKSYYLQFKERCSFRFKWINLSLHYKITASYLIHFQFITLLLRNTFLTVNCELLTPDVKHFLI